MPVSIAIFIEKLTKVHYKITVTLKLWNSLRKSYEKKHYFVTDLHEKIFPIHDEVVLSFLIHKTFFFGFVDLMFTVLNLSIKLLEPRSYVTCFLFSINIVCCYGDGFGRSVYVYCLECFFTAAKYQKWISYTKCSISHYLLLLSNKNGW